MKLFGWYLVRDTGLPVDYPPLAQAELMAGRLRVYELELALRRAAFVAEHLMQMIDRETWRATGGDDGQGHYEGDYREASTFEEIQSWKMRARA